MAPTGRAAYQRPGTIELVSAKKVDGKVCTGSRGRLGGYSLSDDGRYVAFATDYCDLVRGDDNQATDVFRFDRLTKEIELVSVSSLGTTAVHPPGPTPGSMRPSISANGRYVSFDSDAVNLVPGHINATRREVYVRDMKAGSIELISTPLPGKIPEPLGQSESSSISANGRRVAFESNSRDLWDDEPNPNNDLARKIFVYDRKNEALTLASVDSEGNRPSQGNPSNTNSSWPSISGNGRVVMFTSAAMDLVDDDTSIWADVFVHELSTGHTERVSVATGGRQTNSGMSGTASYQERAISHDGRLIVFASGLQDYVPNDTFKYSRDSLFQQDVFLHDRSTGRTERISVNSFGEEVSEGSGDPVISPDGRYVSFRGVSDLGGGRPPSFPAVESDIFLHDRKMGTVERVAVSDAGEHSDCQEGNGSNHPGGVSRGGRFVSFLSCATNLVSSGTHRAGAFDGNGDVYLRDRGTELGVGGLPGAGHKPPDDDDDFLICFTDDICIPDPTFHMANTAFSSRPSLPSGEDVPGADLIGASAAYRPDLGDLFLRADMESIAPLAARELEGAPILYGFDLTAAGTRYQVRVQAGGSDASKSPQPVSFGLFRKAPGGYVRVRGLRGGYGTTGHQVVVALPLAHLGLQDGGAIGHLRAFTALGTYDLGATQILDRIRLR